MNKYNKLSESNILYIKDETVKIAEIDSILCLKVNKFYIARDTTETLNCLKSNNIDIIIVGIEISSQYCLSVLGQIRDKNPKIPIVVLFDFYDLEFLDRLISLDIEECITKPLDMKQLLFTLNKIMIIKSKQISRDEKYLTLQKTEKIVGIQELIENIAHQWREPLSAISACASAIKIQKEYDLLSDDELIGFCDTIDKNSKTLSEIIDKFRDNFSNDDKHTKINLKNIIVECRDTLKSSFMHENIKIYINANDVVVDSIRSYFVQILYVLLENSKEAFYQQGLKNKFIFIKLRKNGQNITLEIYDTAGGIPKANQSKIFEPYFTTKHQSVGSGLGLYTVHELVTKLLNGKISVNNTSFTYKELEYCGARFVIVLPYSK